MATVTFRDEATSGRLVAELALSGVPARTTARELIRLRVREEVARYNLAPGPRFRGLVRPDGAEAEPDGYRLAAPRPLDWAAQADAAERAFGRNGFFMLVGGRQVETLDEMVSLAEDQEVVFVRLVQLVGG
jgi:hypothetical protein